MVFVLSYLALLFGNFGSPCRDYREVKDFLKSIGMEDLYEKCVEEELTMDLIQILSDDNLKCIGVKTLGARMRFIQAASKWEWVQQVTNDIDELSQNSNYEEPGEPEVLGDQPEVVDNEPEVTEPQFYSDQLTTNKVSHSYVIGKYRFWRKLVTKSGLSYFYCDHQGCKAKITVRYSSIENKNLEEPVLQAPLPGPSDHVLANGERHEPDKGKILKKMAFLKIKDEIRKDPLKPVKQIHETVSNEVMSNLHNDNEKLQFLQSMTNSEQASRREYRWRNAIIPPNPKTQRQIDVRNRFAQDHHGISLIVGDDQVLSSFLVATI